MPRRLFAVVLVWCCLGLSTADTTICSAPTCRLLSGELCARATHACPICLVALGANDTRCIDALNSLTEGVAKAECILGTKCTPPASVPAATPAIVPLRTSSNATSSPALNADGPSAPAVVPSSVPPANNATMIVLPSSTTASTASNDEGSSSSSLKNYVGVTVWATFLIAGILLARRMYRQTEASDEAPRLSADSKDGIAMLDSYRPSMAKFYSTRSDPVLTRGRPLDTFRGLSLLSLSSTNTMNNNGTLLERGSKPAVVNVPFHVFDEEDEAIATMRRPNDTFNSNGTFNSNHDSVEDGVCFESMRTRISNMTMIDAKHII